MKVVIRLIGILLDRVHTIIFQKKQARKFLTQALKVLSMFIIGWQPEASHRWRNVTKLCLVLAKSEALTCFWKQVLVHGRKIVNVKSCSRVCEAFLIRHSDSSTGHKQLDVQFDKISEALKTLSEKGQRRDFVLDCVKHFQSNILMVQQGPENGIFSLTSSLKLWRIFSPGEHDEKQEHLIDWCLDKTDFNALMRTYQTTNRNLMQNSKQRELKSVQSMNSALHGHKVCHASMINTRNLLD